VRRVQRECLAATDRSGATRAAAEEVSPNDRGEDGVWEGLPAFGIYHRLVSTLLFFPLCYGWGC
jgi:hypothetical protein